MTANTETHTLSRPDAEIVYDITRVAGSEHPALVLVGQPMCADGFEALAAQIDDRTVVRYDPRGMGRSTRSDGRTMNDPRIQAGDLHALVQEVGGGEPVDVFASSGGAVTTLAWVEDHPGDLRTVVAHEPPIFSVLPDAQLAIAAGARSEVAYERDGFGAGMACFIQLVSHEGEFTQEYVDSLLPDPVQFGLPTEDDGSRNDPILGGDSRAITEFEPDLDALRNTSTRIVLGVGETSRTVVTGRTAVALASVLDAPLIEFRGGHGGFAADEWGVPGDPARFAAQLRAALS